MKNFNPTAVRDAKAPVLKVRIILRKLAQEHIEGRLPRLDQTVLREAVDQLMYPGTRFERPKDHVHNTACSRFPGQCGRS